MELQKTTIPLEETERFIEGGEGEEGRKRSSIIYEISQDEIPQDERSDSNEEDEDEENIGTCACKAREYTYLADKKYKNGEYEDAEKLYMQAVTEYDKIIKHSNNNIVNECNAFVSLRNYNVQQAETIRTQEKINKKRTAYREKIEDEIKSLESGESAYKKTQEEFFMKKYKGLSKEELIEKAKHVNCDSETKVLISLLISKIK